MRRTAGRRGAVPADGALVRALLACPPLALAAFALSTAALLGERLFAALGRGAAAEPAIALLFWIGVSSALGAFWLVNALRLAGQIGRASCRERV